MNKLKIIAVSIASFLLLYGVFFITGIVKANWTSPTLPPPGGNVEKPINRGSDAQLINGTLWIGGDNYTNNTGNWGLLVEQGNVGIGTTNPNYKLEVLGTARFTHPVIVGTPTDSNHAITKSYLETNYGMGGTSSWVASGTNLFYNGGNVGIGTDGPVMPLQISNYGGLDGNSNQFLIRNNLYYSGGSKRIKSGYVSEINMKNNDGSIVFETAGTGVADSAVSLTEAMKIQNNGDIEIMNGNVGIGTTTPTSKLDVTGTGNFTGTVTVATPTLDGHATNKGWVETYVAGSSGLGGITDTYVNQTGDTMSGNLTMSGTAANIALGSNWLSGDGGDEGVFVNSAGNVGIGTVNPGNKLTVYGDIAKETTTGYDGSFDNFIKYGVKSDLEGSGQSLDRWIGIDASITAGTASANKMKFKVYSGGSDGAPGDVMTLQGNGNVGIGTTAPNNQLEIHKSSDNTFAAGNNSWHNIIVRNSSENANNTAGIAFELNDTYHPNAGTGIAAVKTTTSGDYGADMVFVTRPEAAPAVERMRINSAGNVGIGTTEPNSLLGLKIVDSTAYTNVTPNIAHTIIGIANNPVSEAVNLQAQIQFNVNGGTYNRVGSIGMIAESASNRKSALVFTTDDAGSRTEKMRIASNGNVGIGTASPSRKLDISAGTEIPMKINANQIPGISLWDDGTLKWAIAQRRADNDNLYISASPSSDNDGSILATAAKVTIQQAGNVGIGDTTPTSKLDVTGTGNFTGTVTVGTPTLDGHATNRSWVETYVAGSSGLGGITDTYVNQTGDTMSGNLTMSGTAANIKLGSNWLSGDGGDEGVFVDSAGNVGIGTASPGAKLAVNGDILAQNIKQVVWKFDGNYEGVNLWNNNRYNSGGATWTYDQTNKSMKGYKAGYISGAEYRFGYLIDSDVYTKFRIRAKNVKGAFYIKFRYSDNSTDTGWLISGWNPSSFSEIEVTIPAGKLVKGVYFNSSSGINGAEWYIKWMKIYKTDSLEHDIDILHMGDYLSTAGGFTGMSGNVGIGDTTPTSKLDVAGTGNFTGTVTVGTPTLDGHATNRSWVETYVAGSSGLGGITDTYVNQTGDTMSGNLTMSGTAANIKLGSNWLSGDGGDEGVFVSSAGNVGIGTASPGAKLAVNGGLHVGGDSNPGDNNLSVDGTGIITGALTAGSTLQIGGTDIEKTFAVYFSNGVANQKVDLYFEKFWGWMEIDVTSGYSNQNSPGIVRKRYGLGLNQSGSIYTNSARYTDVQGATPNNWAISDVTWDATNSRYRVQIVHRVSTGNTVNITVRAHGNGSSNANYIKNMGITSVYTTDTTTYPYPTVSFPGNVGIGDTTPTSKLDVAGTGNFTGTVTVGTPTLDGHATNRSWVETYVAGSSGLGGITGTYVDQAGDSMSGSLDMGANNITGVNKLTASVVDPLYEIDGKKYATYAPTIAGGLKEEYVGNASFEKKNKDGNYEYKIDFSKIKKGSDLWVWKQVIDFSDKNIQAIATPKGNFASIYYEVGSNDITFYGNKKVDFSFRLSCKRFDWKEWPTEATHTQEKGIFIR